MVNISEAIHSVHLLKNEEFRYFVRVPNYPTPLFITRFNSNYLCIVTSRQRETTRTAKTNISNSECRYEKWHTIFGSSYKNSGHESHFKSEC